MVLIALQDHLTTGRSSRWDDICLYY